MYMKKILSIAFGLLLVLSLASCSSGNNEHTEDEAEKEAPVISLLCDNTLVSAGDEIEIKVNISQAPLTACFDVYVLSEAALTYVSSETQASGLILAANIDETAEDGGRVVVRGMVASTYDVLDEDVCIVTYKVADEAESGSKINLTLQVPIYQVGFDKSGNDVYDVNSSVILNGIVLEVK